MDTTQVVKLISIPTAFLISGYQICLSQNTLPILFNHPTSISTAIFNPVYNRGALMAVPAVAIASSGSAYLAYASTDPTQRKVYGTAAALSFSVLLWTRFVMFSGISRLLDISKDSALQLQATQSGEALRLLKAWTTQNWIRVGLNLGGAMTAFVAASL